MTKRQQAQMRQAANKKPRQASPFFDKPTKQRKTGLRCQPRNASRTSATAAGRLRSTSEAGMRTTRYPAFLSSTAVILGGTNGALREFFRAASRQVPAASGSGRRMSHTPDSTTIVCSIFSAAHSTGAVQVRVAKMTMTITIGWTVVLAILIRNVA